MIAARCVCVAQALRQCKHIYAVIHYINNDRSTSKTSEEQKWGKPSPNQLGKQMYSKGVQVSQLFPLKSEKRDVPAVVFHPENFAGFVSAAGIIMKEEAQTCRRKKTSFSIKKM